MAPRTGLRPALRRAASDECPEDALVRHPNVPIVVQLGGVLAAALVLVACSAPAGPRYILASHYGQRAVKSVSALESVWGHSVAIPRAPGGYTLDEVLIDLPNGDCAVIRWSRPGVAFVNEPLLKECPTTLTAAQLAPTHASVLAGVSGRLRTATPSSTSPAGGTSVVGFEWPDCHDWMEAYVAPTADGQALLASIVSAAHDRCAGGPPALTTATPS